MIAARPASIGRRAVLVSHHGERTGAAVVLLELARAGAYEGFDIEVVLLAGGPLVAGFADLGPTSFLGFRPGGWPAHLAAHLRTRGGRLGAAGWRAERLLADRRVGRPDLLYLNTAVAGRVLPLLAQRPRLVVAHIHELGTWLDHDPAATSAALTADAVIAVSEPVRRELLGRGIAPSRITVVHESIDVSAWPRTGPTERAGARRDLGLESDAFVVLAAGTVDERKGADLFVRAALKVLGAIGGTPVRFLWCGRVIDAALAQLLDAEIRRHGLTSVVSFLGELPSPAIAYQAADVFALPSREDPFPLVCLEAAATGLPVVAFREAGGMASFLESDAGIVVEEIGDAPLADAILRLGRDCDLRSRLGDRAAAKVRERHDVGGAARTIHQLLDDLGNLNRASAPPRAGRPARRRRPWR